MEKAGRTIGRQILVSKTSDAREFPALFAAMIQKSAGGVLIGSSAYFLGQRRQLAALAIRHALPSSGAQRSLADAGLLMSYGASQSDGYRRAGGYAGRILKGEAPAVPANFLTLTDEVIE